MHVPYVCVQVQRFVHLCRASGGSFRFRWNEQGVVSMVWLVFVAPQRFRMFNDVVYVHKHLSKEDRQAAEAIIKAAAAAGAGAAALSARKQQAAPTSKAAQGQDQQAAEVAVAAQIAAPAAELVADDGNGGVAGAQQVQLQTEGSNNADEMAAVPQAAAAQGEAVQSEAAAAAAAAAAAREWLPCMAECACAWPG